MATPFLQVLARLASNNARQQLAFRLCLNNISQSAANPIMAAKIGLQLYPMAVSQIYQCAANPIMAAKIGLAAVPHGGESVPKPCLMPSGFIPMCARRSELLIKNRLSVPVPADWIPFPFFIHARRSAPTTCSSC